MAEQDQSTRETITISNDEGEQETFEVLYTFEQDQGQKYILLTPLENIPEGDGEEVYEQEVYPFRYEEEGENITLIPIEEESEWDMIEEVLQTLETEMDEADKTEG
ncbi:DUF1292 domain-containing protein [Paludifilum halophilum]|uniref:UPF0473 protein CHM34_03380 n=1 Tax=Paludifilum halophilum TaxID=1642702 RepID=A0A235B960_9BACL|nr:DUF1292 domain-containing protein [Paludifilum halophilum]OYD08843.1 hypothetical protein CHM34_03380 [Paludifilum halophilum]